MTCKQHHGSEDKPLPRAPPTISPRPHHLTTHYTKQNRSQSVQQDVDHVIGPGLQVVESVIYPECEHSERSVRLVADGATHRLAPKIVTEQLRDGRGRAEIFVVAHGKYIIVD